MCSRKSYSRFSSMSRASTNAPDEHLFGWLKTVAQNKFHDQSRSPRLEGEAPGGSSAQRLLAQVPDRAARQGPDADNPPGGDDRPLDREAVRRLEGAAPGGSWAQRLLAQVPDRAAPRPPLPIIPAATIGPWIARRSAAPTRRSRSKTWNAFFRSVVDELSAEEVAAELGMTVNAVYKAKDRVKRLAHERDGLGEWPSPHRIRHPRPPGNKDVANFSVLYVGRSVLQKPQAERIAGSSGFRCERCKTAAGVPPLGGISGSIPPKGGTPARSPVQFAPKTGRTELRRGEDPVAVPKASVLMSGRRKRAFRPGCGKFEQAGPPFERVYHRPTEISGGTLMLDSGTLLMLNGELLGSSASWWSKAAARWC